MQLTENLQLQNNLLLEWCYFTCFSVGSNLLSVPLALIEKRAVSLSNYEHEYNNNNKDYNTVATEASSDRCYIKCDWI